MKLCSGESWQLIRNTPVFFTRKREKCMPYALRFQGSLFSEQLVIFTNHWRVLELLRRVEPSPLPEK